ncbi:hypothetical protein SAMN02910317_01362 [Ruminococcaceae bacterium FB2012]|nr:hypothetical protein SAMN02910317_01362 [Ruminococcaceae bacterium FB2012]
MSWQDDHEEFMGYMAAHPEEFPEEHEAMDDPAEGLARRKEASDRREQVFEGYEAKGDAKTPYLGFRYFRADRNMITFYLRIGLWIFLGIVTAPFAVSLFSSEPRAVDRMLTDNGTARNLVFLFELIGGSALMIFLSSKKMRIRKDCHWKYGLAPPPEEVEEKLRRLMVCDADQPQEEKEEMRKLLDLYPCIRIPLPLMDVSGSNSRAER